MTQEELLTLSDAGALLDRWRGIANDRKFRLLAFAACTSGFPLLVDERSRNAVALIERWAEEPVEEEIWEEALASAQAAADDLGQRWDEAETRTELAIRGARWWAANAVVEGLDKFVWYAALEAVSSIGMAKAWTANPELAAGPGHWAGRPMGSWEASLVLEILGNPFRSLPIAAVWPQSIVSLAQALYDGENVMYALHDALLDAAHPDLAAHFEDVTLSHPKGCWVLDLLLSKE